MNRSVRAMALGVILMLMPMAAMAVPQAYALQVDGLACPFCAYRLEKQLGTIEGIEQIDVDIETGRVTVTMADGAKLDEAKAKQAVEAAGFSLRGFEEAQATTQDQ